jgi:hypothetical protein
MKHHILAICLLTTWAQAQLPRVSPHPAFGTQEGGGFSRYFGAYPAVRYQLADASMGNGGIAIKELAFRPDGQIGHNSNTGTGRTWRSVALLMSGCNLPTMTKLYNRNVVGTPTVVFNGSVTWPTVTGRTRTPPSAFVVRFPFRSIWRSPRNLDILADFTFSGGTLANGAPWTTPVRNNYYLDSYNYGTSAGDVGSNLGKSGPLGGCADSRAANSNGASTAVFYSTFGPNYRTPSQRNKHRFRSRLLDAGPGALAFQVLGVARPTGTGYPGVSCQKLWLDLSKPILLSTIRVGTFGSSGNNYWGNPSGYFPRNPAIEGASFCVQSAWEDTGNRSLRLSNARWTQVPRLPKWSTSAAVPHRAVWVVGSAGQGPTSLNTYNPIRSYR